MVSSISLVIFDSKGLTGKSRWVALYFLISAGLNQYNYMSGVVLLQWAELFLAIAVCNQMISNSLDVRTIFKSLCASLCIQCSWVLLNNAGYEPYHYILNTFGSFQMQHKGTRVAAVNMWTIAGSLGQPTLSAAHIAFCIPACLYFKRYYLIVLGLTCIYLTGSAIAMLTALCILWFYLASKYISSRVFIALCPVMGSVAVYIWGKFSEVSYLADTGRFRVWGDSIGMLSGWDILWGKGLGYFSGNFNRIYGHPEVFRHAHNEFIDLYIAFGFIGVLLCIGALSIAFKNKNIILNAMLFGVLVNSFASLTFHVATTALIGIISYSLLVSKEGYHGNDGHIKTIRSSR